MRTRVLIVKHDTKSAMDVRKTLEGKNNIEIVGTVFDGKNAVSSIKNNFPDIIIIDLMLPNVDGVAVMDEINRIKDKNYKFIVMGNMSQIKFIEASYRGCFKNIL